MTFFSTSLHAFRVHQKLIEWTGFVNYLKLIILDSRIFIYLRKNIFDYIVSILQISVINIIK